MAKWLNGIVEENTRLNERLTSLKIKAPLDGFQPGQFVRIGLEIDGEVVARPYSLVNTPAEPSLEIYFNIVEQGPLSPKLFALQQGDEVLVAANPAGFLTLNEVPECKHLWMIATGTGVGPFLSMLKSGEAWSRFERVILCYSVRSKDELAYTETIRILSEQHGKQFRFIPLVTREAYAGALQQRIPSGLESGTLEERAGVALNADNAHVMMCGSAEMIKDVSAILETRGMRKHRRREPGHYTTEKYH